MDQDGKIVDNQDRPSEFSKRDVTIPLLLSGVISGLVCIAFCVVLFLSRDYIDNSILPGLGLIEPTPTLIPTPTPIPCPKVPSGWVSVLDNDFNNNKYSWYLGDNTDDVAISDAVISDGVLRVRLEGLQEGGVYYYNFPETNKSKTDFYFASKVHQVDGMRDSEYGLIFRVENGRHHFFSISDVGRFFVSTRDDQGNWKDLFFGDNSEYIIPGEENELAILGLKDHFTFCINQYSVGEVDNANYPFGEFGIGIMLPQPNDEAVIEYDNFIVYAPEK